MPAILWHSDFNPRPVEYTGFSRKTHFIMKRVLSLPPLLLLVAGALLGFSACDLGLDGAVHRKPPAGRVIESSTGAPIPGARVILSDCDGEFLGNSNCALLDSTQSDAGGNYAFARWGFMVNAQKEGYFTDDNTSALVLDGSEENTDIVLPPYAWLEVTVKNESGAYAISSTEINSVSPIQLTAGEDTTFIHLVRGNQDYHYVYSIWTDANTANTMSIKPYCPGHDTTKITITY